MNEDDFSSKGQKLVPTGKICLQCKGVVDQDDKGACYGHGFLCTRCGLYRLPIGSDNGG